MTETSFNAFCPIEIGDQLRDKKGNIHEITDISCIHYLRTGTVEFRFELDHSKKYIPIEFPANMAAEIKSHFKAHITK